MSFPGCTSISNYLGISNIIAKYLFVGVAGVYCVSDCPEKLNERSNLGMKIDTVSHGEPGVGTSVTRIEKMVLNKASLCIWVTTGRGWHISQEALCAIIKEGQGLSQGIV